MAVQYWISLLLSLEAAATLVSSPFVGYASDLLHSRRLTLLAGVVLLGAAMIVVGLSHSVHGMVAGRILQGVSSAVIHVVSSAALLDCAPDDAVGQYLGYSGAATNLGFLSGPLLGGVVFRYLQWDGLFAIVGAILFLNLAVPLAMLPAKQHQPQGESPVPSIGRSACGVLGMRLAPREPMFAKFKSLMTVNMYIEIWAAFVTGVFVAAIDSVSDMYPLAAG